MHVHAQASRAISVRARAAATKFEGRATEIVANDFRKQYFAIRGGINVQCVACFVHGIVCSNLRKFGMALTFSVSTY